MSYVCFSLWNIPSLALLEHQLYQAFCGLPCKCIPEEIFWISPFFFIHGLATKLCSVIFLFVFLSFQYIQAYSTAFPIGWLGNIQKMFVCCTNSIGSQKVGDSPTWGTERVQFVHRKCVDKNSSDWETWCYIRANVFPLTVFFLPFCSNCIQNQNFASHRLKTIITYERKPQSAEL